MMLGALLEATDKPTAEREFETARRLRGSDLDAVERTITFLRERLKHIQEMT